MEFLLNKMPRHEYQDVIQNAKLIEKDQHGEKVYLLADGRYLKLFRTKRRFSSATLFPHVFRFKRNVEKLLRLDIASLSIESIFSVPDIKRHAVIYQPLEGQTVRDYLRNQDVDNKFFFHLGEYLAELHQKGIFFRSVHFGNIVLTNDKHFGLIDVADMQISRFPLNYFKRLRNFKHFLRVKEDILALPQNTAIEEGYISYSRISNRFFIKQVHRVFSQLKQKQNP